MRRFTLVPLGLVRQSHCSIPSLILPPSASCPASCPALGPVPCAAVGPIAYGRPGVRPSPLLQRDWTLSRSHRGIAARRQRRCLPYGSLHLLYVGHGRLVPGWLRKCILGILHPPPLLDSSELTIQGGTPPGGRPRWGKVSRQLRKCGEIRVRRVPHGACPWSG